MKPAVAVSLLVSYLLMLCTVACQSVTVTPVAAPTYTPILETLSVDEAVIEHILEYTHAYDGVIIARLIPSGQAETVWIYQEGELVETDLTVYYDSVWGSDKDKWAPRTISFWSTKQSDSEALVHVDELSDGGLSPDSRGGYSAKLKLTLIDGEWHAEWQMLSITD
jgi:hypothetical protein